jgi:hypothetical protein
VPGLDAVVQRYRGGLSQRTEELARGADVLFQPPASECSVLKVDHFEQIVQVGYVHGQSIFKDQPYSRTSHSGTWVVYYRIGVACPAARKIAFISSTFKPSI